MPVYKIAVFPSDSATVLVSAPTMKAAVRHVASVAIVAERVEAAEAAKLVRDGIPFQDAAEGDAGE